MALASGKLRDLLGPYVHSMASQLLAEGLPVGQAIMPALVHAIAVGPTRDASMGGELETMCSCFTVFLSCNVVNMSVEQWEGSLRIE